jgi:hypothetical protein
MIPFEIFTGITLICSSFHVYEWLGDGSGNEPQVVILTVIFFLLRMFTATHDIGKWNLKKFFPVISYCR